MDIHSPEQRSFNMSRIKGVNTRPEMLVRKLLWANGYRYRLHAKDLPGKPDIVFRGSKAAIFVHGCFWHRHGCRYTTMPSTRQEFWIKKFADNITWSVTKRMYSSFVSKAGGFFSCGNVK